MIGTVVALIYSEAYPRLLRSFPPYQRLRAELLAIAGAHAPAGGGSPARILDLAAGPGELAFALAEPGHTVVGIEPNHVLRRIATRRARGAARGRVAFAASVADRDHAPFDVVLSLHALYADHAWADTLGVAFRTLRPGGLALFVNFAAPTPVWPTLRAVARRQGLRSAGQSIAWLLANAVFNHFRRPRTETFWPPELLEARVRAAGFEIEEVRRTFLNDMSALVVARKDAA